MHSCCHGSNTPVAGGVFLQSLSKGAEAFIVRMLDGRGRFALGHVVVATGQQNQFHGLAGEQFLVPWSIQQAFMRDVGDDACDLLLI